MQLLLGARVSVDARQVLLPQPYLRHPSPIPDGLLSLYRLAQGEFASYCRSFVIAGSFALEMVRIFYTRSLGRLSLLGLLLRNSALVDGQPGPRIKADEQPLLLLVDTTIEGASPTRARQV